MRAGAGRAPRPRLGRDLGDQGADPALAPVGGGRGVVGAGGQHVGQAALLTPHPQPLVLAVDLIGGQPADRHPGIAHGSGLGRQR
jgi:hypothetical protein